MRSRWGRGGVVVGLLAAVAACSSDDGGAVTSSPGAASTPVTAAPLSTVSMTAPPTTAAATTTTEDVAASTSTSPPTTATPTTTLVAKLTGPRFPDSLGVQVDSAPGVNTRGDTRRLLPEGLFVHIAWEADPNDSNVYTVKEDDVPILEAYANATREFYAAATSDLIVIAERFAPYMVDAGAQFVESLSTAAASGYVNTLGSGVLLRPYVVELLPGERAVLFDCTRSDEEFILRDGGSRTLTGPVSRGQLATLVVVDGVWKVEAFGEEPLACQ